MMVSHLNSTWKGQTVLNAVKPLYDKVTLSKTLTNDTPYLTCRGEVWNVFG